MAIKREINEYCPVCGELTAHEMDGRVFWKYCTRCPRPPGPPQPPMIYHKDSVIFKQKKPDQVHTMPVGKDHICSPDCWCQPERIYVDPENNGEVWLHRTIQ